MPGAKTYIQLPIKKERPNTQAWSIVVAALVAAMSLIGLFFTKRIYPTEELVQSYKTNDLVNLLIGLPGLLGSIWLAQRGKLIGLLFWPGALLYVVYNYTALLVGVPFGWPTLACAALLMLSAFLLFDLLRNIDGEVVQKILTGAVFERFSGVVLAFFGIAFFFLAVSVVSEARASQSISMPEVGVSVADMLLSVFLLVGGILFFLRKPLGYANGPGMLFAAMLLFIGVLLFVIVQPLLSDAIFSWNDLIVLGSMAIICLIPFGLMTRGILLSQKGGTAQSRNQS